MYRDLAIHGSKYVFRGRKFNVLILDVTLPTGVRTTKEIVEFPGAVAILPLIDNRKLVMIRQYRVPIKSWIYEIPAGTLKPCEKPEECALRELEEETGYSATELEKLLEIYPTPGYSSEIIHIYIARGLKKGRPRTERDEVIETMEVDLDKAIEMIREGIIRDGKTIIALLYYITYTRNRS
ncbi:MAG: ADP-ribose pyrophosphatase [Thermoprotei archaeon]|nr:MAG: ADP-ribose pyrophosphatase [Thermoprotei archaeon]